MSLIAARDVSVTFGGTTVLDAIAARIEPGERVGFVGPNGAGKTTFLRILAGEVEPDRGEVARPRGTRIGYLPQRPEPPEGTTALGWVLDAFGDVATIERELERVHEKLAVATDASELERLMASEARLRERFEAAGGYDVERRAEAALTALGVASSRFHDDPRSFSGGERARVALARALVREPDVLLLDEPTNHLDLDALEWLEERLVAGKESVVVVSHDRYLLDSVATGIWELRRGILSSFRGNYSEYREQREALDEAQRREHERFARFVQKEEDFIRRNIAGQKTRQAKGRRKILARRIESEGVEKPATDIEAASREPTLKFEETARAAEIALAVEGLAAGYGGELLVRGVDLEVRRGERAGIVGPNGCGKTTLLRALLGEVKPERGRVRFGPNVRVAYYRQEGEDLPADASAISAAHDARPTATLEEMRDLLGALGLSGEKQETSCGLLSGGERARVSLARVILARPNLLLLDEPTNHLDVRARHALESALAEFEGAIVAVSHDRYFLDEIATKIVAFEASGAPPRVFAGGYTDYRARRATEERRARALAEEAKARERPKPAATTERTPGAGTGVGVKRKRRSLEELERAIIAGEEKRKELHVALADEATYRDGEKVKAARDRLARVESELAELNAEWDLYAAGE